MSLEIVIPLATLYAFGIVLKFTAVTVGTVAFCLGVWCGGGKPFKP